MSISIKLASLCATAFVIGVPAWLYANAARAVPSSTPAACSTGCDLGSGCEPCDPAACDPAACDPSACEPAACDPGACAPAACDLSACTPVSCEPASCDPAGCDPAACIPGTCTQAQTTASSVRVAAPIEPLSFDLLPTTLKTPVSETEKVPCCADAFRNSLKTCSMQAAGTPPKK